MEDASKLPFTLTYNAQAQQVTLTALPGNKMDLHHFEKDKGCWVFQLVRAADSKVTDHKADADAGAPCPDTPPSTAAQPNSSGQAAAAAAKAGDAEKEEPDYVVEAKRAAARAAKGLTSRTAARALLPKSAGASATSNPALPTPSRPGPAAPSARLAAAGQLPHHPPLPRPLPPSWSDLARNPPPILTRVPGGSRLVASCDTSPSALARSAFLSLNLSSTQFTSSSSHFAPSQLLDAQQPPRATSVPPGPRVSSAALSAPTTPALSGSLRPSFGLQWSGAATLTMLAAADHAASLSTLSSRSDESFLGSGDFGESLKEEWAAMAHHSHTVPSQSNTPLASGPSSPEGPQTPVCSHMACSPAAALHKAAQPCAAAATAILEEQRPLQQQLSLPRNFSGCPLAPGFFSFLDDDTATA